MIWRSARLALVVGTILVAINNGSALLSGDLGAAAIARIGLNYAVPFLVSLYSQRWGPGRGADSMTKPGRGRASG